ncbi:MAG: hypothetical protein WB565_13360 [Acidimicrobiales bacterium]
MRAEKFLLLLTEASKASLRPMGDLGVLGLAHPELVLDELTKKLGVLPIELYVGPLLLDVGFDKIDEDGSLRALGGASVVRKAEEVEVLAAMTVLGLGDAEPISALCAVDRAPQIVLVDSVAPTSHVVGGEDLLNPLKGFVIDDRLVVAGVKNAEPDHFAGVVRILK